MDGVVCDPACELIPLQCPKTKQPGERVFFWDFHLRWVGVEGRTDDGRMAWVTSPVIFAIAYRSRLT